MSNLIKVSSPRAPSCVAKTRRNEMRSAEGTRWAYERGFKRSIGRGIWEPVMAWDCWERKPGERARLAHSAMNEEYASSWVSREAQA